MNQNCIARARSGDPVATEEIVNTLRPRLARMAAHYAHCCQEDADDLLQEAWTGLLDALPEVDLRIGIPEQYLLQRARWRLLDAIKHARVRRCAPLDDAQLDTRVDAAQTSQLDAVEISAFLTHLKATQRTVLTCLLAGLTWRETGGVLGCSSANVAYHVRQIKECYEAWQGEKGIGG